MQFDYQIIVIGAGAGGLVVAIGGAKAGKKVLLIEKGNYGGDCTNYGCVPSKSLIAASHYAHHIQTAKQMGIETHPSSFYGKEALGRTRRIVNAVREKEEPEALAKHGVDTLTGTAQFEDPHTLLVDCRGEKKRVSAEHIVVATGSHPVTPEIEGIDQVDALTNETIFDLEEIPGHLAVIGGGPIGCELAQAFRRLGSRVSLIHKHDDLLVRDEPESRSLIKERFELEGIELFMEQAPFLIEKKGDKIDLYIRGVNNGEKQTIEASHLLIAAGRRPSMKSLNLEAARIKTYEKGIDIDDYGRTSVKHIFAIGDVNGYAPFTHMAEYQGRAVLFNLIAPWPFRKKIKDLLKFPHVTYCDPEVAAVGLKENEAQEIYGKKKVKTYFFPFKDLDRAITTGRTEGFVKVITKKWSSKILGATICSPRGGEMLMEISVAMKHKIPLRKLANIIHPYPTYSLAIRKTADKWLQEMLIPTLKGWVGKQ